ncbi:MAG TPA: branched-chain amino acid ABC transporter permease [Anaerolineae bacterium]|nr:branched-chain amino acid ABC transporter permease [Anaerolineae bacterium]
MQRSILERLNFINISLGLVGAVIVAIIVIGSIATLQSGHYSTRQWFDFVVFGFAQGSIYALIALGYTMVYGVLRMINFAHGEIYMSGAFTGYFVADALNRSKFMDNNPWLGLVAVFAVAMTTSVIVATLLERIAYRPLRRAPRLVPLITAIGASFFLQYTFRGLYGSQFKAYPEVDVLEGVWVLGGEFTIQKIQVVVVVAAALLMFGLYLFVQRTRTGKAMRAVSENKDVAALMGIDVDAIIVRTFMLGAGLAGAAGVLYALMFRQVSFFMGFIPGIKAFTAAVLGGIGNIPGAMLGGLFLGLFESVGPSLFLDGLGIPAPYQLKDVIAFSMLVLVLIFRPQGILGERLGKTKA